MDDLVRGVGKKAHKGRKSHKKRPKSPSERPPGANSKAFTFSGGRRAVHRRFQHASEVAERRLRPPRLLKAPLEPPPLVVVVQGPRHVGKSTLIASLVRLLSKRSVSTLAGPITLVASRARRLTLIECGNSLIEMIDCSKIADVALVLIDASYGFEMETFEFVNMLQVHGFPRVVCILTHLDAFKDNKTLRKTRKTLKKRFWAEIYDGAKMFYFSGLHLGRYKNADLINLSRFLSSLKPPIISWRLSHPYSVSLRHEISESSQDSSKDPSNDSPKNSSQNYSTVSFYGYVYGGKFNISNKIHIPGFGDFAISSISNFQDPCQINTKERTLKDKNRNIYAPYCDVGSLMLDDDAMYIQLFKTKEHFTEMPDEDKANISDAVQMVRTLQKIDQLKKSKMELNILNGSKKLNDESTESSSVNEDDLEGDDVYENHNDRGGVDGNENSRIKSEKDNEEEDSDDYDSEEDYSDDLSGDEEESTDTDSDDDEDEDDEDSDANEDGNIGNEVDNGENAVYSSDENNDEESSSDSSDDSDDESEEEEGEEDELAVGAGSGVEIYDEISQRVYFAESTVNTGHKDFARVSDQDLGVSWDEDKLRLLRETRFANLADDNEEDEPAENDPESEKFQAIQEAEQKRLFQETVELDATGNVGHFVRITVAGFPAELARGLGARPIVLGSIQASEQGCGFVQVKLKRHRWFPKILKTNDPLLFSVGWRRFQSLPVYCLEDRNQSRVKMLKYTPEHLHCLANVYGPLAPPSFGVLAVKSWERVASYRISASGVTVGTDQSYRIMKKLKLIGEPYKIMKNTCFIKNMFNSELEVIKCIGSKIQTASGIRGQIKKPIDKNGAFRATFEDKILLSDLVVLKSWIAVETRRFYNLLVDSAGFQRVKSLSELRRLDEARPDSRYERKRLLRRPARHFNEIRIPRPIIEKLPFSSKPKVIETPKDHDLRFDPSEHEKKLARMLHKLHTIRKDRLDKRNETVKAYKSRKAAEQEKQQLARDSKLREIKKRKYTKASKSEEGKRAKLLL